MPRFRAELVFYFDAEDARAVPRRLHEVTTAAATAGFDFHSAKAEPGSEPEPREDGWTAYAPLPDPHD
jgi:hypothetical protein